MMKAMRKHTKTILWIVVIAFIGTIFFVWGMDLGRRRSSLEQMSAAVINGQAISYSEFAQHWEQRYRQIIADSEEELSPQQIQVMRNDLMESLIDNILIKQQFDKLKLTVTPQEVASQIYSIPAFQQNGKFSREKYLTMLRYNRISPQEFESEQENAIKLAKMNQILRNSVVVTESDVRDYFQVRSRKIKLHLVAFYWKNYLKNITVPSDDITAYFNSHRQEYDRPEEVRASHILIRVDSNASEEEKLTAKLKLDNIRSDIKKGADFAEMARKYSDDPGSKEKGGDLGFFRRGMMVKPFEEAAFSLKTNELSDLIETPFGFHLIKVTGRHAAQKSTLAEVRGKIVEILKEKKARKQAQKAAINFMRTLKDAKHLQDAAQQLHKKLIVTKWVKEDGTLPQIENSEKILDQAFDLPLNKPSHSLLAGEGIYFVEVVAEAYQPFNEKLYQLEHDTLIEKLRQLRGDQLTQDWLKQARAEAKIINNIEKEGIEVETEDQMLEKESSAKPTSVSRP